MHLFFSFAIFHMQNHNPYSKSKYFNSLHATVIHVQASPAHSYVCRHLNVPLIQPICTPCLLLYRCLFTVVHLFQRMTCLPRRPLLLDEVFVLIPRHRVHIISTALSTPSTLEQLFHSLIADFLSVLHKLNILLVPDSPTASAHCRLPRLPPCRSHFFCGSVWFTSASCESVVCLPTEKTLSFLPYPFSFILALLFSLCAPTVAFIFIVLLSYWPLDFFFLIN